MDDFDEMIERYPELVLLSKSPPTWKGILKVNGSNSNCSIKVKLKVVVPLYPALDNTKVYFGASIAFLFGTKFKKEIDFIIKRSESLTCFVQELAAIIEKRINDNQENSAISTSIETNFRNKLLKELESVLSDSSEVEFSSTNDLSAIKLSMNEISMVVQPSLTSNGQNSWKILYSDLPEMSDCTLSEKKSHSLKEIRNIFQKQVNTLTDVWDQLRKIDNNCWVTDPTTPKPHHLYRRIYLSSSLSFLITLNPLDPCGYPKIKFLGAKREVEKYRVMIQDDDVLDKWDLECSVYENLLTLLNIDEFPQAPLIQEAEKEEGMVGDSECCICFSMELENGKLPDEICNNQKCRRNFHSACLFQWLQELAANKIVFNKIFGPCPNCNEEVSCNVPSS